MIRYGSNIAGFDFVNYFARNLDNVLIGKVCGVDALGVYSKGYQLLMLPINHLRNPIQTVAFPAMSRMQADPAGYRNYYRKIVSLLASATMPLTAYLFIASEQVVELVLGDRWAAVAPLFSVLALTAFIQPCASLTGLVTLSLGMSERYRRLGFAGAVVAVAGFLAGVSWGPAGVAWAYAATTYLGLIPFTLWAFEGTPLRLRDFLCPIFPPAAASVTSAAVVYIADTLVGGALPCWLWLMASGAVFGVLYIGILLLLPDGPERARQVGAVMQILLRRHKGQNQVAPA